jgi:hypothetical protein
MLWLSPSSESRYFSIRTNSVARDKGRLVHHPKERLTLPGWFDSADYSASMPVCPVHRPDLWYKA